jgi:hypothetical protein
MTRPGQDPRRPPEGLAPAGSSGQAARSLTFSRDDHPWRQLMDRAGVSLAAQDLTGRITDSGRTRLGRFGDGNHSWP